MGAAGPPGPPGTKGIPGPAWDAVRQGNEMIALAQDMLRKVDTVSQSSDEAAALLLDQMRMIEKQIGLDEKGLELTQAELGEITENARNMMRGLLQFNGTFKKAKRVINAKKNVQNMISQEIKKVQMAESRYMVKPESSKSGAHRAAQGGLALLSSGIVLVMLSWSC